MVFFKVTQSLQLKTPMESLAPAQGSLGVTAASLWAACFCRRYHKEVILILTLRKEMEYFRCVLRA